MGHSSQSSQSRMYEKITKFIVGLMFIYYFASYLYPWFYTWIDLTTVETMVKEQPNIFQKVVVHQYANLVYMFTNTTSYYTYFPANSNIYNAFHSMYSQYNSTITFPFSYITARPMIDTVIETSGYVYLIYLVVTTAIAYLSIKIVDSFGGSIKFPGLPETSTFFSVSTNTDVTFRHVIGQAEVKEDLKQCIQFFKHREAFNTAGYKITKGLLFTGPPGTGKTLVAKAFAKEAGVSFISVAGSSFMEMYVGTGPKRVRELFTYAREHSPAIIFIDEIDSVGRSRSNGDSGHHEGESTLNQLLVEMDGFTNNDNIMVIGATNRPELLDSAITRSGRFDKEIVFDLPNKQERIELVKMYTRGIHKNPNFDEGKLDELATLCAGLTGADIANIVNQSVLQFMKRVDLTKYAYFVRKETVTPAKPVAATKSLSFFTRLFENLRMRRPTVPTTDVIRSDQESKPENKSDKINPENAAPGPISPPNVGELRIQPFTPSMIKQIKQENKSDKINPDNAAPDPPLSPPIVGYVTPSESMENKSDKLNPDNVALGPISPPNGYALRIHPFKLEISKQTDTSKPDDPTSVKEMIPFDSKDVIFCHIKKEYYLMEYPPQTSGVIKTLNGTHTVSTNEELAKAITTLFPKMVPLKTVPADDNPTFQTEILDKDGVTIQDLKSSIDIVIVGMEKKERILSPEMRKQVAYHEAGHALMGYLLKDADPPVKISIVPRGRNSLGHTQHQPDEDSIKTKEQLCARIAVLYGGRCAEMVMCTAKGLTTGAHDDLKKISTLVETIATQYGMMIEMSAFDKHKLAIDGGMYSLPVMYIDRSKCGIEMQQRIDHCIGKLVADIHTFTYGVLQQHKKELELIAAKLLEQEVLLGSELDAIVGPDLKHKMLLD